MVQINADEGSRAQMPVREANDSLSDLGRTATYQAVRVYRCYDCNNVISEAVA